MKNFKVGDKVKRVTESRDPCSFGVVGQVYTVIRVNGKSAIEVIAGYHASSELFELVTEKPDENNSHNVIRFCVFLNFVCKSGEQGYQESYGSHAANKDAAIVDAIKQSFSGKQTYPLAAIAVYEVVFSC